MSTLTLNQEIKKTFDQVKALGFKQKQQLLSEQEIVDRFLDAIPKFKKELIYRTNIMEDIADKVDLISRMGKPSQAALKELNGLISVLRDWHSVMVRDYVSLNSIRKHNIAKGEIKAYKAAIDGLKEGYEDLESIYFFLPSIPEFKETTRDISLI